MATVTELDTSRLPLVTSTIAGRPSPADISAYLTKAEAFYRSNTTRFVLLVDVSGVESAGAGDRLAVARHLSRNAAYFNNHLVAAAYVLESRVVRGMLTAVFWVAQPAWRWRVFESSDDAREWLARELSHDGVSVAT